MALLSNYTFSIVSGRLSLTSGTPVTTADVTAATSIYFSPYIGELTGVYDGSNWQLYNLASPLSIAVPATTSTMYDLFLDYNAGTPQLAALAWTNDTTRATALTTQDGIYVLTGATDHRYLGSFRTTGVSGQTEDSLAKRHLWNYYNRVQRPMRVVEATNSWTYSTATIRQANGSTANQLDFVVGVAEVAVMAWLNSMFNSSTATVRQVQVGIGVDVTNAFSGITGYGSATSSIVTTMQASHSYYPAVGRHFVAWLENGAGADTQTWYGDNGGSTLQTGIYGSIWG